MPEYSEMVTVQIQLYFGSCVHHFFFVTAQDDPATLAITHTHTYTHSAAAAADDRRGTGWLPQCVHFSFRALRGKPSKMGKIHLFQVWLQSFNWACGRGPERRGGCGGVCRGVTSHLEFNIRSFPTFALTSSNFHNFHLL